MHKNKMHKNKMHPSTATTNYHHLNLFASWNCMVRWSLQKNFAVG